MSEPAETPDLYGAYPRLSDAEIDALAAHGGRRSVYAGEVLMLEGTPSRYFYVLLNGHAGVHEDYDGRRRLIRVHGPGRFLGELSILTGQVEFVTTAALDPLLVVRRDPGSVVGYPYQHRVPAEHGGECDLRIGG